MSMAFEELEELFADEKPTLLQTVARYTRDRAEAEDIVQEAFCRALVNATSLERGRVGGWLTTVARRLAIDAWRKRANEIRLGESTLGSLVHAVDHLEHVLESELARSAKAVVHQLPTPQREALLGVAAGMSIGEIADARQSTRRAVEGHLRRGRSAIRKRVSH